MVLRPRHLLTQLLTPPLQALLGPIRLEQDSLPVLPGSRSRRGLGRASFVFDAVHPCQHCQHCQGTHHPQHLSRGLGLRAYYFPAQLQDLVD